MYLLKSALHDFWRPEIINHEPPHDKTNTMASTQSDQSLRCPHVETLGPWLPTKRTAKTLISLGAQVILLVLWC